MKTYLWLCIAVVLTSTATTAKAGLFDRPDFFERGQEQFEEEIRRFERGESVPSSSLEVDETTLPWSRVVIKEAGFTVLMPPGAITHEDETVESPEGNIHFELIATHPLSSRYLVAYSELVAPERVENPQEVLKRSRDYIIENNVGLTKIADDDFMLNNHPGKQFQLQNKDETIVYRLLLVNRRLYVLAVSQQNDAISAKSIDVFFASFELI